MGKKIKSVKLAKEFVGVYYTIPIGTIGVQSPFAKNIWIFRNENQKIQSYCQADILECTTGLFDIEYEDENFVYDYPFRDYSKGLITDFCNKLADWCEAKFSEKGLALYYNITLGKDNKELCANSWQWTNTQGLKFGNRNSAELFLAQLELNPQIKQGFIELFKSNRL